MAWTFWMPSAPTNLTGSLVAGGSLDANTTYYFRVFAWDRGNTTTSRTNPTMQEVQVLSPHSATFSITTDATNKSVALTWDAVLKRNGVTQVDAYEVLISTSDNFDTAQDNAILSSSEYFYPTTVTNSATISTKPTVRVKNVHEGFPLMEWDGVGSGTTFEALRIALLADPTYAKFTKSLTPLYDTTDDYLMFFMGSIVVNRWMGDSTANQYSFTSLGNVVFINGTLHLAKGKYKLQGNIISVNGQTHRNSSYTPMADSIVTDNFFRCGIRQYLGKSYATNASGVNYLGVTNSTYTNRGNINQLVENSGEAVATPDTWMSKGFWTTSTVNGAKGLIRPRLDFRGSSLFNYLTQASANAMKKVYLSDCSMTNYPQGFGFGTEITSSSIPTSIYYSSSDPNGGIYDCIFTYPTQSGWDPMVTLCKDFAFFIGKTLRVQVVDTDKNPIAGAKVAFYSSDGVNLTKGNNASTIAAVVPFGSSVGNNFELAQTTIPHTTTTIAVREATGSIGYTQLKENTAYWLGAEKIKILLRGAVPAWNATARLYTAERGLDGSDTIWQISGGINNSLQYLEALEYLETDVNGTTFNPVIFKNYKGNPATPTSNYNNYLSVGVAEGRIIERSYSPISIVVKADGYVDKTTVITDATAIASGIAPLNVLVTLEKQVPLIQTIDGEKMLLNLSPEKAVNSNEYVELE